MTQTAGRSLPPQAARCLPLAGYLFAHGFGHYQMATRPADAAPEGLSTADLAGLAAILFIGPLKLRRIARVAGVGRAAGLATALLSEALLVWLFAVHIRRQHYALLYINVSIMLCIHLPRALLVGSTTEADVSARVDRPLFFPKLLSSLAVAVLIVAEPFYCDEFVAAWGGHLLFDVALLCNALLDVVGPPPPPRAST